MKQYIKLVLCIFFIVSLEFANAQSLVKSQLSKDSVKIGDLLNLTYTVDIIEQDSIFFPEFENNMIEENLYVLSSENPVKNLKKSSISKTYKIAAFKDGDYIISQMPILLNPQSDSLILLTDCIKSKHYQKASILKTVI